MYRVWWNQVTNAVKYISETQQSLLNEKSVLLKVGSMPWRDTFEEIVKDAVKQKDSEKRFEKIVVSGGGDSEDPGDCLLKKFCKKEKRAEYRPSKGHAKFFAENDDIVIHDRYIWVVIDDINMLKEWMKLVSEYISERGKKAKTAVFVLEWSGDDTVSEKKGIRTLSFDDYIGEYDRIVFSTLASSGIREIRFMQVYLAELVSNLTGNDIELAADCIKSYKLFLDNPVNYIQNSAAEELRSNGESLGCHASEEELTHRIWQAQIRTVYPFLEEYREEFIQKHLSEVKAQLPLTTSWGDPIKDPKDVELGMLSYLAGSSRIHLTTHEFEKLSRFKEARNKLSHLSVLTSKEVRGLLEK